MRTRAFLLVLLALSAALTYGSGFYATSMLVAVVIAALVLAFLWSRANIRWVDVEVVRLREQAQVGDVLEEQVMLRNRSKLPVPFVQVEDMGTLPEHRLGRVLGTGAETSHSWVATTPCVQRGLFTLGPLQVSSGDPLGIFTARRVMGEATNILIHPATLPLPGFVVSTSERVGESEDFSPSATITPNVSTVRQYAWGDSLSRIHWKSTARHGRLMVKEFEVERQGGIWLLLDMAEQSQWGEGPESTEEYGVTAAASIAASLLALDKPVGLAVNGAEEHLLYPEKGSHQRFRLLERLARVRAKGREPLSSLVTRLERQISPSNSLVVISASLEQVQSVASLMVRRGLSGAAVILDAASFGGDETGRGLAESLLRVGFAAYLIRRGDDLSLALSVRGITGATPSR